MLELEGRTLPPIPSRAGRSLLAYLAVHSDRPHRRDLLAGMLWPELPESRARRRLSQVLWQIQDLLTDVPSPILTVGDTLAFDKDTPHWIDVVEFDQLVAPPYTSTRLRRAVDLYRGDFMAGFYDDWVVPQQELLRHRYLDALTRLVDLEKGQGNYLEALGYARRITHEEPLREEAHQEVMRLCVVLGRISEALQQFERCRAVLAEELGSEPSRETELLYHRILERRTVGRQDGEQSLGRIPFVAREEERRTLVDAFESALGGRGGVVLVEGDPGVGKTRLVAEVAEDARWRGFSILWGTATEGPADPFGPILQALRSGLSSLRIARLGKLLDSIWLQEAGRLLPELTGQVRATVPTGGDPERVGDALVEILMGLASIGPHVVVIDDLQWADPDSLSLLTRIAHRVSASRLVVVVIYRGDEARGDAAVWGVLRELDRTAGLSRVVVPPLSVFDVAELVRRTVGPADPRTAAILHRQTGGNTLFVLETLRVLSEQNLIDPETGIIGDGWAPDRVPISPRVSHLIAKRLENVEPEVREVFEAMAVAGTDITPDELAAVTGLELSAVLAALDDLLRRHLAEEGARGFCISHDQIRQVVVSSVPSRRRRRLHRLLADHLQGAGAAVLAHHLGAAGLPGRASSWHEKAGDEAATVGAFGTAARHYEEALRHGRSLRSAGDRWKLLVKLESTLDLLARRADQERVLDHLEDLASDDRERAFVAVRRASWLAHMDRLGEALAESRRGARLAQNSGDRSLLVEALMVEGRALRWSGKPGDAVAVLSKAAETADPPSARVSVALASALVDIQQYQEAETHAAAALEAARQTEDVRAEVDSLSIMAVSAMERGLIETAENRYREALDAARRVGYRHAEGMNLVNLANLDYFLGRVARAMGHYEQAAALFKAIGNRRGEAIVDANRASIHVGLLGDLEEAESRARNSLRFFEEAGEAPRVAQCLDALGWVSLRRGEAVEARRLLDRSLHLSEGHRWFEAQHLLSRARLEIAVGDFEAATRALGRAEEVCEELGYQPLLIEAASLRAYVLYRRGETDRAIGISRRTVSTAAVGVERPHLLWHRHSLIAEEAGEPHEARLAAIRAYVTLEQLLEGLDDRRRGLALALPEHAEIVRRHEAHTPRMVTTQLPRRDAPTGRALAPDELVTVTWTVDHPDDLLLSDLVERRRARLVRLIHEAQTQGASPALADLADALGVGISTVRRDLEALRAAGHALSTRGRRMANG